MLPLKCHLITFFVISTFAAFIDASETQHRTKAASEKQHDLWCHRCDSMVDGEKCLNVTGNYSMHHNKCTKDQKKCQVKRISMSTSTDEITGKPSLWLLQRNCSEICEPGCIVIGERTKLHSCITCCDEHNFCNAGSSAGQIGFVSGLLFTTALIPYCVQKILLPGKY